MSKIKKFVQVKSWVDVFMLVEAACSVLFLIDVVIVTKGYFQNAGAFFDICVYVFAFLGPILGLAGLVIGNVLWINKKEPNRNLALVSIATLIIVLAIMLMGITY